MTIGKLTIALAALLAASTLPGAAHPPAILNTAAEKVVADDVLAFRKTLAQAIASKDAAKLRDMYFAGFTHTHTTGKTDNRDARIVTALAGDPVIETAVAIELEVRAPNDWLAVVTGTSPIKSMADGKTYAVRWMQVYSRTERSWALVASQATRSHEIKP